MTEVVRVVVPADADDLRVLDEMSRADIGPARGGAVWLEENPSPTAWPMDGDDIWVAELDGLVVGFLRLALAGDIARIVHVYVRPECRDLGFGDGLLAAALDEARRRGCRRLDAVALPGDRGTKNLYERAGVVARSLVLSLDLGVSGPSTPGAAFR